MKELSTIIVRLPKRVHANLRKEAQKLGISLNKLCVSLLKTEHQRVIDPQAISTEGIIKSPIYLEAEDASDSFSALISEALSVYGDQVVGILLYGSFARGTATASSDIDVLMIVNERVVLDRDVYERFHPSRIQGREVSLFVVHLPRSDETVRGIWLEAALDGIVLYDKDLMVSRFLANTRNFIASGGVKRMFSHGHPYWVYKQVAEATHEFS